MNTATNQNFEKERAAREAAEIETCLRIYRAGYVLAMRVLQSDLVLDDETSAARDYFIEIGGALKSEHRNQPNAGHERGGTSRNC